MDGSARMSRLLAHAQERLEALRRAGTGAVNDYLTRWSGASDTPAGRILQALAWICQDLPAWTDDRVNMIECIVREECSTAHTEGRPEALRNTARSEIELMAETLPTIEILKRLEVIVALTPGAPEPNPIAGREYQPFLWTILRDLAARIVELEKHTYKGDLKPFDVRVGTQ